MRSSDANEDYWFDAAPLTESPRRRSAAEALSSVLPGKQHSDAQQEALLAFATANGLSYISWLAPRERSEPLPSLVLDDASMTLISGHAPQRFEFGNHGWRFWKGEGDGSPSRRGYIAIRHGLALPHLYLDANGPGAATLLAAASTVVNAAGFFDFERTSVDESAVDAFRKRAVALDLPTSAGFTAYVDAGRPSERTAAAGRKAPFGRNSPFGRKSQARAADEAAAARAEDLAAAEALLTGPAGPLLAELADSFDVEVEENWVFAYSTFGELSTLEPEIWAWAFGSASRLVDVLEIWGLDATELRQQAWYTSDRIERPARVDGALQALVPKPGSRIGKLLFGRGPE